MQEKTEDEILVNVARMARRHGYFKGPVIVVRHTGSVGRFGIFQCYRFFPRLNASISIGPNFHSGPDGKVSIKSAGLWVGLEG